MLTSNQSFISNGVKLMAVYGFSIKHNVKWLFLLSQHQAQQVKLSEEKQKGFLKRSGIPSPRDHALMRRGRCFKEAVKKIII